ncbi:S-layer homology domain-containing protein [Candidatus Peribacteria bacterium]|nr:S-layer homology domain-containing protein [Candidatus Peribacteria bacterium]
MKPLHLRLPLALLGVCSVITTVAASSVFPDVPDGHVFKDSIEELVRAGVVNGNPDGTFRPSDNVNRAAMLKMLYLAKGKVPDPLSVRCFPDVTIGSWYEPYVCDAAARRYVNGYPDGTFGPDKPVKRVEALKMIATVFEIPLDQLSDDNREIVNFADVSLSAWYTQYLLTAYNRGVLPIPGEQGAYFYPDKELTRGEAAAYIYNALRADYSLSKNTQSSRSSSSSAFSSAVANSVTSQEEQEDEATVSGTMNVALPFSKEGKFKNKETASYVFDVASPNHVHVVASLQAGQPGQLTCRLYLLRDSGFSDEYFLGYQEGNSCYINAALNPGIYQLQLQPTAEGTTFAVNVTEQLGDGNDGFREAPVLSLNKDFDGVLTSGDFQDWYKFSVISEQKMTVVLGNPTEIRCIVYAMRDVDLQSFSGPQCNQLYTFPSGTYYVSLGRKAPKSAQQSYSVRLEK